MDSGYRLGRIVCIHHGYSIAEVLADDDALAGFRVFGHGASGERIYASPDEAMQLVEDLVSGRPEAG